MAKGKVEAVISSFTPEGEFLAVLLPTGIVKIWNTSNGSLLAEWKQSEGESNMSFSCLACNLVGKKRKKKQGTFLVALGTYDGDVLVINASASEMKWKSSGHYSGGIAGLSFVDKGLRLHVISGDGVACEMNSETGELTKELKISKKILSSSVCFSGDKILAAANSRVRVLSSDDGNELLKFSTDMGEVQHMCMLENGEVIITTGFDDTKLQLWKCEASTGTVSSGPVLTMRHPPLVIECKNGCNGEEGLVVLSVSESGIAYVWNLKTLSREDIVPTKIMAKTNQKERNQHDGGRTRKNRSRIFAARLLSIDTDGQVKTLIAHGPTDSPQFSLLYITSPGEDIVVVAKDDIQDDALLSEKGFRDMELDTATEPAQKERSKKRAASDLDPENTGSFVDDGHEEPMDGVHNDDNIDEPTMGEKLANLNLTNNDEGRSNLNTETFPPRKPPTADSVHVLLKQALHADDRTLILGCLFRQDEKVIANSVAPLNPSDVYKLLQFIISIVQSSRGAVLACVLPWLRSLLLQHTSVIMSQDSSLLALNSLYQIIESRISTFDSLLQLSSSLHMVLARTVDGGDIEETAPAQPVVYQDKDTSDEEESGSDDAMETDDEKESPEPISNISEESDGMDHW